MKCKSYYHFFEVMANPTRFKIIESLMEGSLSVSDICLITKEEQSKISHNLRVLSQCNVVENKREGKKVIYSLNQSTILPMLKLVEEHVKVHCKNKCGLK